MAYAGNQMVKLSELLPHKRNYRTHDAQMPGLEQSLERRGQYRSIVAHRNSDGTITILAGHGVAEAAKRRGMTSVRVDMHEGLTEEQQLEILVADNELSRKAADDRLILSELLTELRNDEVPLTSAGWEGDELDKLLDELGKDALKEGAGGDDYEPLVGEPRAMLGDLWQLGEHRLLVGDCRDSEQVARLMNGEVADVYHGDPPYGIKLLSKRGHVGKSKVYDPVIGDDELFDPRPYLKLAKKVIMWGANHFADKLPPSPFWLVWDKQGGAKDITYASCELAWCNDNQPARVLTHVWDGFRRDSEQGDERSHPTQKPVAVIEWALSWLDGTLVLDTFGGSGTTMIACQRTGRKCYMMEIEPHYADVILNRYEAETGLDPQLIERIQDDGPTN